MNEAPVLGRGVIWLVPFAIVVAALGFETDWGRSVSPDAVVPVAVSPQPVAVALLPEYRIDGGLDARKETVDRVLFNPTRRPAPPATQAATSSSTMKKGQYTLTGTTVVGNVATAFLREVNGGKSRSVRQGETLAGMEVAEVKSDRVRLKQGGDVEDLQLKVATGPRTTIQTAVVTAIPAVPGQPAAVPPGTPGVAAAAAGGTSVVGAGRPTRPGVPPPPAAAPPPTAATPRAGTVSVSELLAERRRAARAAAEAASTGRPPVVPGATR